MVDDDVGPALPDGHSGLPGGGGVLVGDEAAGGAGGAQGEDGSDEEGLGEDEAGDETVHGGIRGAKASLKACVECHASTPTGSVAKAPGDFCVACHSYAAVKIDCFECHASTPKGSASAFHVPLGPDNRSPLALRMRAQLNKGMQP